MQASAPPWHVRSNSFRRRFALALLISLVGHLALLSDVGLPEIEDVQTTELPPIAARIVPIAPQEAPRIRPSASTKPLARRRAARAPTPAPAPAPTPAISPVAEATPPAMEPQDAGAAADAEQSPQTASAPPLSTPAADARPAATIPLPSRIDLEFDLARGADQATIGRVVHRFRREGTRYSIRSVASATGIAALFVTARYIQESSGVISAEGLRPEHFSVRRGRVERVESADFDWSSARASVSADGSSRDWPLRAGAQDQLSLLHQISLLIGAPPASVMITNGRRFFEASVEVVGRDAVSTGIGLVNAVRVRIQREGEMRMDVWLAPDHGNLPIKVRLRDRRGDEIDQVLAAMRIDE